MRRCGNSWKRSSFARLACPARRSGSGRPGHRRAAGAERFPAHRRALEVFGSPERHVGAARPDAIRIALPRAAVGPDPSTAPCCISASRRVSTPCSPKACSTKLRPCAAAMRSSPTYPRCARSAMPGVGLSRWRHRPQGAARAGHRRHPPARQAQLTWLRSWPDAVVLDCLAEDLESQATALVARHL